MPASTQTHAFFHLPRSASTDRLQQTFEEADAQLLEASTRVKAAEQALGTNADQRNTYNFSVVLVSDKLKECEEMVNRLKAAKSDFDRLLESLIVKKELDPEDEYKSDGLEKEVYKSKQDLSSQLANFKEATEQLSSELAALPVEGLETNESTDRSWRKLGVLQRLLRGKHREDLRRWWGKWGKSRLWTQFGAFDASILREIEDILREARTALQRSRAVLNDYQRTTAQIAHLIRSKETSSPALQASLQSAFAALNQSTADLQKAQASGSEAYHHFQRAVEALGRREERETDRLAALESHLVMKESRESATEAEMQELGRQWKLLFLLKERLGEAKEAIRQLESTLADIKKTLEAQAKSTAPQEIVFEVELPVPKAQSEAGQMASNPQFEFEFTEEKVDLEEQISGYMAYVGRTADRHNKSPRDYLSLYLQEEGAVESFIETVRQEASARADSFVSLLADLFAGDASGEDSLAVLYALAAVAPSAQWLSQRLDLASFLTTGGQIYLKDAISAVYFLCQASPSLGESLLLSIRPASISLIQHLVFMICYRLQESQTDSLTFFKAVDSDNSKRLSLSELTTGLRAKLGLWIKEEQVVLAFRELDKDKSGEVTRLEFTRMINLKEYYARCEKQEYRVTVWEFARTVRDTLGRAERRDVEAAIQGFRGIQ